MRCVKILILFPIFVDLFFLFVYNLNVKNLEVIYMISQNLKKELLKSIDITKQSAKNNLEVTLESYTEIMSRLDILAYLIINDDQK